MKEQHLDLLNISVAQFSLRICPTFHQRILQQLYSYIISHKVQAFLKIYFNVPPFSTVEWQQQQVLSQIKMQQV